MSEQSAPEFLSLTSHAFLPNDENSSPIQPHLDTLFAEFARTRSRLTPPPYASTVQRSRSNNQNAGPEPRADSRLDLRTLEYVTEYDSHLMCPICHVPFVDPIVVECDHTFCESCFLEYRNGGSANDRSRCPSCRAFLFNTHRKASRLITNMCNDLRVCCPNTDCSDIMARGCVESHIAHECPEEMLACPDIKCSEATKRKHFVPSRCVHQLLIKCVCGSVIDLGISNRLDEPDKEGSNIGQKCDKCREGFELEDSSIYHNESMPSSAGQDRCPGAEFGCSDVFGPDGLEAHIVSCTLSRMAPYMKKQSLLIKSLQEQLLMTNLRSDVLESGVENINDKLVHQIQPRMEHLTIHDPDVEEIERDDIPGPRSHHDLLLPAHLRELTPSPTPMADHNISNSQPFQHLLALHENLQASFSTLEQDVTSLSHTLADLEARSSMQLMNETLRIKEELAHTNAALFSTRAQVQWLLNRERIVGQQQALSMMRGRQNSNNNSTYPTQTLQGGPPDTGTSSSTATLSAGPSPTLPAADRGTQSGSGSSSVAASPMFTSTRPMLRRLSGGSQERVKL